MRVCIICEKEAGPSAIPVKEDFVIRSVRRIKSFFNTAKMNELFVCQDDIAAYDKKRKSFEKSLIIAAILAGIIIVLAVVVSILSWRLELWGLFSALLISGLILLMPFFRYSPALLYVPEPLSKTAPATTPNPALSPLPLATATASKPEKRIKKESKKNP